MYLSLIHILRLQKCEKQPEHKITEPAGMLSSQSSSQPVGRQSGQPAGCCGILIEEHPDFTCQIYKREELPEGISKKKYTKWLDYDKIKNSLLIRNRQPGDYFVLDETCLLYTSATMRNTARNGFPTT